MARQTLMWTTLPNGITPDGRSLRVSVMVSPRLDPETGPAVLASFFPDWEDWPRTLSRATFHVSCGGATVRVRATQATGPNRVEDRVGVADSHVWRALFGDTLYANMVLLGAAYQQGHVPISASAIEQAITVNGAAVETNREAFRAGRLAIHAPQTIATSSLLDERRRAPPAALADRIAFHARDIEAYQDAALAERYRSRLVRIGEAERTLTPGRTELAEAVADAYRKLLMVKDEYEVARLLTDGRLQALIAEQFDGVEAITFHMAPPLLAPRDKSTGHPRKIRLAGWWALPVLRLIARAKVYGEAIPCSGPLYDSMTVEGGAIRLKFQHADGGLKMRGEKLTGFAIAGADGKFVWADAKIDGDTVVVSSPEISAPAAVRYAFADNPAASLYNGADLPASPFRTDQP